MDNRAGIQFRLNLRVVLFACLRIILVLVTFIKFNHVFLPYAWAEDHLSSAASSSVSDRFPDRHANPVLPLLISPTVCGPEDEFLAQLQSVSIGQQVPGENDEEEKEKLVDVVHAEISRKIQGTGAWMDSFFGNRRYETELNESYVRYTYNVFLEEGSEMVREPDLKVRIILPQLQEKTHLILSGAQRDRRDFSPIGSDNEYDDTTFANERNTSAALYQTVHQTAQDSLILRAGLQLRIHGPAIMLGPRYRVLFPLDKWNLRFIEELLWRSKTGWESKTTTDLERPLPNGLFFRATNDWIWKEDIPGFIYAVAFQVGQPLNDRRGLEYEWGNIFHTKPIHELTEIVFRIRYRQQLWRKWLYFEVGPQYRFPRDRDFNATPGILFRLDMILGKYT